MTAQKKQKQAEPEPEAPDLTVAEPELEPTVEIPYKGQTFIVPRDRDDWPTEGLAYLSEDKFNLFVRETLEIAKPGQWAALCQVCPTRREFNEFFEVFGTIVNKECTG